MKAEGCLAGGICQIDELLRTSYCPLPTSYILLPTVAAHCLVRLLPTAHCLLLLPTSYFLLPTVAAQHCLLPTSYCPLPTSYFLLSYFLLSLPTAYFLLSTSYLSDGI